MLFLSLLFLFSIEKSPDIDAFESATSEVSNVSQAKENVPKSFQNRFNAQQKILQVNLSIYDDLDMLLCCNQDYLPSSHIVFCHKFEVGTSMHATLFFFTLQLKLPCID